MEIERRFLVPRIPDDVLGAPSRRLRQGYVTRADDSVEVRVRATGAGATLTIKSTGGLVRSEHEIPIDRRAFDALWATTAGRRIEKRRLLVPLAGELTAEVDIFDPPLEPLVIAEVEFPDEESARVFVPPAWFGSEITEDRRYRNSSLAGATGPPADIVVRVPGRVAGLGADA